MKNKAFTKLSAEEKEAKILGALDRKTEGLLLPKELLAIANAVPRKQQYTIRLYQSNTEYWRVLSLDRTIRITPVLIPEHPLDAAAVITRSKADPKGSRQLHIFVPPARTQKGHAGYESKRVQAAYGEYKRRMAYEALILLLLLALLLFITRLWPILLLVILGIFIATLQLLFLSSRNVPPTQPPVLLPPCKTDSNKQAAYCAFIEDINAGIFQSYPDARWIWESPGALRDLEAGKPVIILLNRAGGYRRAELRAEHGRLKSLVYLSAPVSPPKSSDILNPQTPSPCRRIMSWWPLSGWKPIWFLSTSGSTMP